MDTEEKDRGILGKKERKNGKKNNMKINNRKRERKQGKNTENKNKKLNV